MWFVLGLLFGAALLASVIWLKQHHISVRLYEWLIGSVGFGLIGFSLQNFLATRSEHWSAGTPMTFLLVFGVPGMAFLVLAITLVCWRYVRIRKHASRRGTD